MKITVLQGQSIIDIAIQNYGSADTAMIVAQDNGLDVSDNLAVGQLLEINQDNIIKNNIVQLYSTKKIVPATNFDTDNINEPIDQ